MDIAWEMIGIVIAPVVASRRLCKARNRQKGESGAEKQLCNGIFPHFLPLAYIIAPEMKNLKQNI